MERAIIPTSTRSSSKFAQDRENRLGYSTFSGLIELTRAKFGYQDPAARKIQAFALEVDDNVACAKVTSALFNDFLQLVKFDGQWKIVNVLWTFGPDSPGRSPLTGFDPEKEKPAIQAAALDYVEGTLAGDAARVEKALHLEACRAVVNVVPATGKTALSRTRYSSLVEPVRAKLNASRRRSARSTSGSSISWTAWPSSAPTRPFPRTTSR
jgi:hypothetical protein